MQSERVLGVDPGTRMVGWAVLEGSIGSVRRLGSGVWKLGRPPLALTDRMLLLSRALRQCLEEHEPERLALEAAFFGKNARSALRLGEARGVVMVTAAELGVPVLELPPALVKRRVAGAGAATKQQIARLVRAQLGLEAPIASADETDALAVALCALLDGPIHAARGAPPGAIVQ